MGKEEKATKVWGRGVARSGKRKNEIVNACEEKNEMIYLKEDLIIKKRELEKKLKETKRQLDTLPQGKLYARKNGKYFSYYLVSEDGERKYISKNNGDYIRQLAQRKYVQSLYKQLQNQYQLIKADLAKYHPESLKETYDKLSPGIKKLVEPIVLPDDMYADSWLKYECDKKKQYPTNNYSTNRVYEASNGTFLRSKSEIIISEELERHNIPYIYEYPVKTETGKILYPDFYMLNKRTRKAYFYEHFGMMDEEEYCNNALLKIEEYARNGIRIGKNFLVSFETSKKILNANVVNQMIVDYLE